MTWRDDYTTYTHVIFRNYLITMHEYMNLRYLLNRVPLALIRLNFWIGLSLVRYGHLYLLARSFIPPERLGPSISGCLAFCRVLLILPGGISGIRPLVTGTHSLTFAGPHSVVRTSYG